MTDNAIDPKGQNLTLTGNVYLRFVVIGFMYLSQGLPLGLFGVAIPTYLAEQGILDKAEIAQYLVVIGIPWAFKFLAGPLMDYFAFLVYGHRRPWVIIAQLGMVLTFTVSALSLGWTDVTLSMLMVVGFSLNLFGSTQDVAVDGMAIGILLEKERSKATALMFGSQRIGNWLGAVGGGYLLGAFGVPGACAAGAIVTFCIMLLPLMSKERAIEKRFPWSQGQIAPEMLSLRLEKFLPDMKPLLQAIVRLRRKTISELLQDTMMGSLIKALVVPVSLFFILASFCDSAAGGLLGAYLPSYSVQDLNWDDLSYNSWYSTINLIAAGIGVLLSPLFDVYGQRKCITVLCVVTFLGVVGFLLIPQLQTDMGWGAFMLFFWVSQHLFAVLIISACMQLVSPSIAASQFAIYMSIANLSSTIGNSFIAVMGETWSVNEILALAATLVLIAPVFFWLTGLGTKNSESEVRSD